MATKLRNIFLFIILISVILSGKTNIFSATEGTTYTYTISVDRYYIRTQEAYLASTVYMQRQGLVQPSDLFIYGKEIFIADTGNKRIVVYNKENGVARNITNDAFEGPSGLFVTDERMYIADPIAQAVFICDRQGNILTTISRPKDSPLMSKSAIYKPVNLQSPFTNTTQKSHLVDIFLSSLGLFPTCRTRSPTKMAVWRRTDNGVPPTPLTTSGDRPSSVISGVT